MWFVHTWHTLFDGGGRGSWELLLLALGKCVVMRRPSWQPDGSKRDAERQAVEGTNDDDHPDHEASRGPGNVLCAGRQLHRPVLWPPPPTAETPLYGTHRRIEPGRQPLQPVLRRETRDGSGSKRGRRCVRRRADALQKDRRRACLRDEASVCSALSRS